MNRWFTYSTKTDKPLKCSFCSFQTKTTRLLEVHGLLNHTLVYLQKENKLQSSTPEAKSPENNEKTVTPSETRPTNTGYTTPAKSTETKNDNLKKPSSHVILPAVPVTICGTRNSSDATKSKDKERKSTQIHAKSSKTPERSAKRSLNSESDVDTEMRYKCDKHANALNCRYFATSKDGCFRGAECRYKHSICEYEKATYYKQFIVDESPFKRAVHRQCHNPQCAFDHITYCRFCAQDKVGESWRLPSAHIQQPPRGPVPSGNPGYSGSGYARHGRQAAFIGWLHKDNLN